MKRVGVFVKQNGVEIRQIMQNSELDYAQLHGEQTIKNAIEIGSDRVIRVLWPNRYNSSEELLQAAKAFAPYCACFLLDAGASGGGSGHNLDWDQLATMELPKPWLLAGGLHSGNIDKAVMACKPNGIDLNSGLEAAPGIKDHNKMREAILKIGKRNRDERLFW